MRYQERTLADVLRKASRSSASLAVVGPRQSGKTTLVRHLFGATHAFCSLDDPSVAAQARDDPGLLLLRFPPPVIFDEIQYAPQLLPLVKRDIDEHRSARGRYVLTGSQLFPLMQGVTESLAGRVAVTSLLSFSLREAAGEPDVGTTWKGMLDAPRPRVAPVPDLIESVLRGGYPEPALNREMNARLWHASYVQTYLERDVRTLRAVGDLRDFERLLAALSARTASLINFEDLARDLGISGKTVKSWVSVLETSGQVLSLKPYHVSLGKRLVKRPKIYLLDTGMLAFFLGVTQVEQVWSGMSAGPMFETAVLGQLHRLFVHRGEPSRIHFWRTAAGHEVDFVIEDGPRLIPIEAKLTTTPTARDAVAVEAFQKLFGRRAVQGYVVCLCDERFPLTRSVDAVPLGAF